MAKRVLPVYIEDDQRQRLKGLSEHDGVSMAELVRQAIVLRLEQAGAANDVSAAPDSASGLELSSPQVAANDTTPPATAPATAAAPCAAAATATATKPAEPEVPW